MGLDPLKHMIFVEHERWRATVYQDHGIIQVGPVLAPETYLRIELVLELAREHGALVDPVEVGEQRIDLLQHLYRAQPATIYAGGNEIQRNILATAVLGLPRSK